MSNEQADVVLMHDRLENFLAAFRLSQRARRVIRQNLIISLGTVVVLVSFAILGQIPLTIGVVGHEGSTVVVVMNSLRLLFGAARPGRFQEHGRGLVVERLDERALLLAPQLADHVREVGRVELGKPLVRHAQLDGGDRALDRVDVLPVDVALRDGDPQVAGDRPERALDPEATLSFETLRKKGFTPEVLKKIEADLKNTFSLQSAFLPAAGGGTQVSVALDGSGQGQRLDAAGSSEPRAFTHRRPD